MVDAWYELAGLRDAAERDGHVFVVALKEGFTAGFAHAAFDSERNGWILLRIYVIPDRWGDGIGTALLERVETALEDRGVSTYELAVLAENDVGVSFYESRGFDRVETVETELAGVGTTEHRYRKQL